MALRLIPAHAGKTAGRLPRPWTRPAHPRSRGENVSSDFGSNILIGSSPLTRGKRSHAGHPQRRSRLIPAHAGKTKTRAAASLSSTAHPRSRGENLVAVGGPDIEYGSSPLTRGKRQIGLAHQLLQRLIPAHAGKTRPWGRTPASRGGSSPLTRGKPRVGGRWRSCLRLIPAHAGKTKPNCRRRRMTRAHPRSRGENASSMPRAREMPGSSPLTRGKPVSVDKMRGIRGLIPAHAGKTASCWRTSA